MKIPAMLSLNTLLLLSSYTLSALPETEIKSTIKEAELFNDFFWQGNVSTLFLKPGKKGTFTGWAKAYYEPKTKTKDRQVRKITNYLKGRPMETIIWKPDGTRCTQTNLKDGNGQELHWHTNGKKRENSNYKNGLTNGKFTLWYPHGQVEEQGTYLNGSLSGKVTHFDPKGKVIAEAIYKEGSPREGTSIRFLGNKGKSKYTYEKGIEHGAWIWWDTDWKTLAKGTKHQGKPKGATTYFTYYKNGQKESESDFVGNKLDGAYKKWSPSGKAILRGEYKKGFKNGSWSVGPMKITYENGKIKKQKISY